MKIKTFASLLICLAAASCVKEKLETIYNKQETQIDSYLSKNQTAKRDSTRMDINPETGDTTYTKVTWTDTLDIFYNKGAVRLVTKEGAGERLNSKGAVSFYYAGYVFTGSISSSGLFATNHQATAESSNFTLTDPDYNLYETNLSQGDLIDGLKYGVEGVQAGEECSIIFSGKYGFGKDNFGIIPANSALLYKIWVVGVSND
ncbi:MAG: FKBP-type peptidyl-prolyl cis-trans isomerase [Bacteroidales bacterium]|nr:FKBP-type peptidyl-prolyl cis-trans isomerase [Bacteroidales bacterium]